MKVPFVDLSLPHQRLRRDILAAVEGVLDRSDFILGKPVEAFEQQFAAYCGVSQCVGLSSGCDALRYGLMACGVGPGDEVVTVGGTLGKITGLSDNFVTIEVADGVEIKVQRHAVQTMMPKGTIKDA